ncbi:MAG: hypothetical protein Tsb0020_32310 [Haliangiales bacterium]
MLLHMSYCSLTDGHGDMGNIIFGGIAIIAGLTGEFALIGTDSPLALSALGALFVIWGLIQIRHAE